MLRWKASLKPTSGGGGGSYTLEETFADDSANEYNWSKGASTTYVGTLVAPASSYTATRLEFYLKKTGTGGGTITAEIWSATGSAGSETPSALLATSTTTVDASGVSATKGFVAFDFAGQALASGTKYFFVMKTPTTGDTSNYYNFTLGSSYNTTNFETVKADATPTWSSANGGRGGYCRSYSGGGGNPGTDNLVAWLGMDEGSGTSVDDSTSNNNDFTLTNGTWVGSGKVGSNAVRLDGSGDYISSDAAFAVGANVCTVSFWMYWTDSGADEKFIYELGNRWWQTDGSIALSWIVGESVFKAAMHDGSGNLEVKFPEPSSSQWVYVTVVYNGSANTNAGEIKLYYNGTSQSGTVATNTKNQASNIPSSSSTFFIGANSVNTQEITIDVDTFAVFSDELTQAEITWLYNSGNGKSYSDVSGGGSTGITLETSATTTGNSFSSPTSVDVNIPAVSTDDVLLLLVVTDGGSDPTSSPPSGWTKIVEQDGTAPSASTAAAYWKRASSGSTATTETWSSFFPSGEAYYIWVGAYSGCVSSVSPVDAYGSSTTGYGTPWSVNVTTNTSNAMIATISGSTNSTVTSTWSDGTELIDTAYPGTNATVSVNEKLESTAGSKTRTVTPSVTTGNSMVAVALRDTASTNNNFDFTVTTTTSSETFTIPCQNSGTFDATVDWGDGSTSAITAYNDADLAHIYATAGDHDISISGTFPNIYFNNGGDKDKVKSVTNLGSVGWTSFQRSFRGCSNMTSFDAGDCDTSSATSAREMFYNCTSLTSVDVSSFDTSSVTTMQYIFGFCSSITSLDLSNFDTSSVTLFANAFRSCTSLTSVDVSSFDTSSATNMISMFSSCSSLTTVTGIEDFDITGLAANQMTNFLNSSTLSTAVYDELLVNWEGQTGYNNQNPHFGSSTYTAGSAAATARAALVTAGWSITDGGTA